MKLFKRIFAILFITFCVLLTGCNRNDDNHEHLYDKMVSMVAYLASSANCSHGDIYYYSCECGEKGTTTYEVGKQKHNYINEVINQEYLKEPADCDHGDVYYYSCECGEKGTTTYEVGEEKHTFLDGVYNGDETLTNCGTITYQCSKCVYKEIKGVEGTGGTPTLKYEIIDENTCKITGIENANNIQKIIVPEYYNGYKVIEINYGAFDNCNNIASITLPFVGGTLNGTSNTHFGYIFGSESFLKNNNYIPTSLSEVIITSCTTIYDNAFHNCNNIKNVIIYEGVTYIGGSAFSYCNNLINVQMPNSVTHIGLYAFEYCSNLTNIILSDNITSIGEKTFQYCTNLNSIVIPNGVTSIGPYAFNNCSKLESVIIGEQVKSIGGNAFSSCDNLIDIVIPKSVTFIGIYAFSGCKNLESIIIPNGVINVMDKAFAYCDKLTIYCKSELKPSGWSSEWNYSNRPVVWGYTE